jgi:3-hydroxymyristoyl/3-hydroxydecanoyl-(acyl carrier protein) dehydratase
MQEIEISRFLRENRWVSNAIGSGGGTDGIADHIHVEPSLAGHRLIRDQGMQEFEKKILDRLPNHCSEETCWDIQAVNNAVWPQDASKPESNLPRILTQLEDAPYHRLLLVITPELGWFRGHFPKNPVLPGVVQLHWAVIAATSLFGFQDVPVEIKRLKFKGIVTPPRMLELALSKPRQNEVQFGYASLGQQHSEGRLVFTGDASC